METNGGVNVSDRHKFPFNSEFFTDGNALIGRSSGIMPCVLTASTECTPREESIPCGEPGCRSVVNNEVAYTEHYESRHRHVCTVCRRSFHSRHYMDLHYSEKHDPFFEIKVGKEPSYRCLLVSCIEKFRDPQQRKDHMIRSHKFPHDFRFYPSSKQGTSKDPDSMEIDGESSGIAQKKPQAKKPVSFGPSARKGFPKHRLGTPWHRRDDGKSATSATSPGASGDNMDMAEIVQALPVASHVDQKGRSSTS